MQEGSPLKHLVLPLVALLLLGCSPTATQSVPPPQPLAASPSKGSIPPQAGTADPRPDLLTAPLSTLTAEQLQQGLLRLVEEPGTTVPAQLARLFDRPTMGPGARDAVPWIEADLNGDSSPEYALTLLAQPKSPALFVIHQQNGLHQVDLDPLTAQSPELMQAYLHSAADLTGEGRPQLIWYRPELIATGPQPYHVFVTRWEPGRFTHLPGPMLISWMELSRSGRDLHLTGVSRAGRLLWRRTDTYRFQDGAFRLVDRAFAGERPFGYDRFWDGLVSEGLGQLDEAEAAYQAVLAEGRPAHPGSYLRYNAPPLEPTASELAAFSDALRAFAQFRLDGLYRRTGRQPRQVDSPFPGLLQAGSCQGATAWAEQNPAFLAALNQAITHAPWTPAVLCTYPALEELVE